MWLWCSSTPASRSLLFLENGIYRRKMLQNGRLIMDKSRFIHRGRSFTFQIKLHRVPTTPSLSLSISCLLFIQILQTGCFFQFSTFTSFAREWHYASVIMQFITNNRFVYGGPISCSRSALQFQNNNNNT